MKGFLKPNFLPNIFEGVGLFSMLIKTCIPQEKGKKIVKFEKEKFRFRKKQFQLQYRYFWPIHFSRNWSQHKKTF